MTRPDLPAIPNQAGEVETLRAFLDYYRAALIDRVFGLSVDQLQVTLPPSTLTLARIVGHMIWVEGTWFRERFDGAAPADVFADLDWEADGDAEMTLAGSWTIDDLMSNFDTAVADSTERAAAAASLDQLSKAADREGEHWNLRWIMIHMIEEYARHCGHADLIRESIDGDIAR